VLIKKNHIMLKSKMYTAVFGVACFSAIPAIGSDEPNNNHQKPNIVFIMADDLGYGEVSALNVNPAKGKIVTPHVDRLVAQGMTFTDAHSGSAVCTPTRYGLLTGRYAWRTWLQSGVVQGHAPCLIDKEILTIGEMLRENGYKTGIVGKWHLNYIYADAETGETGGDDYKFRPPLNSQILDGPLDHGFDYFYGYHHSRDMETVVENRRAIAHKPVITMLPGIEEKSIDFINRHVDQALSGQPFFLYVALSSPHSPVVPAQEWQGKSGLNEHADFVMQTDHTVGKIVEAIDAAGLRENTMIIFTSDNGTSGPTANIDELEEMGHYPSWILRGSKADIWDGGHRVPFIVRWPGITEAGSQSSALICHTDFMVTVADVIEYKLPMNAAVDGVSYLSVLYGKGINRYRPEVVHHSFHGKFAIRSKQWKLILAPGSGGWSAPRDEKAWEQGLPDIQLYDMETDIQEQKNLQAQYPEMVNELIKKLETIVENGRSTPGLNQKNDIENIDIWKK
jgi:arylsulfatase A-like enzyme